MNWSLLKRYIKYLEPYRWLWLLLLLITLISSGLAVLFPMFTLWMIDIAIAERRLDLLLGFSVGMFGVALLQSALDVCRDRLFAHLGQSVLFDLRSETFGHLKVLSPSFYAQRQTGDLMARLIDDVDKLEYMATRLWLDILMNLLLFCTFVTLLLFLNWKLASFCIPLVLLSIYIQKQSGREMRDKSTTFRQIVSDIAGFLQEVLSNMRFVQLLGMTQIFSDRYINYNRMYAAQKVKLIWIQSSSSAYASILFMVCMVMILGYGGAQAINGGLTLGALIAFNLYFSRLYAPGAQLVQANLNIQSNLAALARIFELQDVAPQVHEPDSPLSIGQIHGRIQFTDVSFSYDGKRSKVLEGINFTLEPGQITALVGPNGAGKSTIVSLIARLWDPEGGCILLDEHNLKDYAIADLRRQVGVVSQDIILFNDTIENNLRCSSPNLSREQIVAAAQKADADDFIRKLPEQYSTIVGERGMKLSGGQRQRLAITRAILQNPRILILDEATSSVDSVSTRVIQQRLSDFMKDRTVLIVTHQLKNVNQADKILVLVNGQIKYQSDPSQLPQQYISFLEEQHISEQV